MNRRKALRLLARGGVALGAAGGLGLVGRHFLLPPPRSRQLGPVKDLACRLFDSLDAATRERCCVEYDHPLRQYHNRGVGGGGLDVDLATFDREQRSLLTDLLHAGLSTAGRDRLPEQFYLRWPGVHALRLLICGDPHDDHYQLVLSGPHLNLRLGGKNREEVAFGGPQVYGDQRGDERQGLPGNVYRYQFLAARRLLRSLEPDQQEAALLAHAPIQTQIELQGRHGTFPGVAVAGLSPASRGQVRELVEGILSTWAPQDVAHARLCLAENGGIEGLHLAYYEDGEVDDSGEFQIFRLEGPAAVFYFRGAPHVHAFVNVGRDGDRPLSVGEVLGENPRPREGLAVKKLFEAAMRDSLGADLAFYPQDSVAGRLRAGTIRTGDVYCLESWQDTTAVARIQGADIRGDLREELERAGAPPDSRRAYTVATTGSVAADRADSLLGPASSWRQHARLRDVTIEHLARHGFGDGA